MTAELNQTTNWHTTVLSTLGELTLVRDDEGLRGLYFAHHWYLPNVSAFGPERGEGFDDAVAQLTEYLGGERHDFDLPLAPRGDALPSRVWRHVAGIPYGHTVTYGEIANELNDGVTGAQQIGAAVARNPLCIFIPCHRVVGRGGKLTGYAGGIARKRHLLELEAANRTRRTPVQPALMSGSGDVFTSAKGAPGSRPPISASGLRQWTSGPFQKASADYGRV